jgi:ElaB/YqjD/DUF883 family membrane-anchored ribosome-binding protein
MEKSTPVAETCCATACIGEMKEARKRVEKGLNDSKAAVSAKFEDGKEAAERLLKRGRHAVEDCVEETAHQIKHYPMRSVAVAFAAGAALGFLVPRFRAR